MTSAWCYRDQAKEWSAFPAEFLSFKEQYQPHWMNAFSSLPEPLKSYARQEPPSNLAAKSSANEMDDAPPQGFPAPKCSVNSRLSRAIYYKTLKHINGFYGEQSSLAGRPLLVSQPTKVSPSHTRALAEVAFERMDVGAFYAMKKASLAAMAMGRPTACVVELGPFGTNITPVFEGYHLERVMQQYAVGGILLDWILASSLQLWDVKSHCFNESFRPYSQLRRNRQRYGTFPVAVPSQDEKSILARVSPAYLYCSQRRIVQDLKETVLKVNMYKPTPGSRNELGLRAEPVSPGAVNEESEDRPYELPDGKVIYVPDRLARDVSETLLTPSECGAGLRLLKDSGEPLDPLLDNFPGISTGVIASAFGCHVDIRQSLLQNIVVAGGTAAIEGLMERIAADLSLRPHVDISMQERLSSAGVPVANPLMRDVSSIKFKVASQIPMERKFTTWVGGSVLAMLSSFRDIWIAREDWAEYGPVILERRKIFT